MLAGTKVLLTNVTEKNIEDVVVGDSLMGMVRDAVVTKIDQVTYPFIDEDRDPYVPPELGPGNTLPPAQLFGINDQTPWLPAFHPVGINVRIFDEDIFPWAQGHGHDLGDRALPSEWYTMISHLLPQFMHPLTSSPLSDPNKYNLYTTYKLISSYTHSESHDTDRELDVYRYKDDPEFDADKWSDWNNKSHEYELEMVDIISISSVPCVEDVTLYLLTFGPGTDVNGPVGPLGTKDIEKDGDNNVVVPCKPLWGSYFANNTLVRGLYKV